MSKKCPICRSINCIVEAGRYGDGSPSFTCLHCHTDIREEHILPVTLFDRITVNEETLAEEFVAEFSIYGGRCYWFSLLLAEKGHSAFEQRFNTKAEAIAATVAKLKEVEK